MKIKNLLSLFLISANVILITSSLQCHKHKDEPQKEKELPPITQEGKNTFGCKVNGEIWIPYYSCSGQSANPCGEILVDVRKTNVSTALPLSITIAVGQKENGSSSAFTIETGINQGISTIGDKIDSVTISYLNNNGGLYYNYNYHNTIRKFEITKLDTVTKTISGIFETTLYQSITDSVKITDGRFDLKFSLCKCSN